MVKQIGKIFDISRFCLNDGPGIRTTVFFKGCPLNCVWCHNPESKSTKFEILYDNSKCVNCGKCMSVCDKQCHIFNSGHIFNRTGCITCGNCAENCISGAIRLAGKNYNAEEIISEVLKDKIFYEESGGGLTVSGGEPLMQIDFLEQLLKYAKQENLHTCIETCGYAKKEYFDRIIPFTDCFLFDYKETDPEKHKKFTGKDNALIIKNLELLNNSNADIILRLPLIPGYNDTSEHLDGIAVISNRFQNIRKIEIMPYHPLGTSKTKELGIKESEISIKIPDSDLLKKFHHNLSAKVNVPVEISV